MIPPLDFIISQVLIIILLFTQEPLKVEFFWIRAYKEGVASAYYVVEITIDLTSEEIMTVVFGKHLLGKLFQKWNNFLAKGK